MSRVKGRTTASCIFLLALVGIGATVGFGQFRSRPEGAQPDGRLPIGTEGRLILIPGSVNGRAITFLVDTGASQTVFDLSLRDELGISRGFSSVRTPHGTAVLEEFQVPKMAIGNVAVSSPKTAYCDDLQSLRDITGEQIDAVLGMNVLRQYVLQIDFDSGALHLSKTNTQEMCDHSVTIPLHFVSDTPHLVVDCGAIQRSFLIDTGATSSCLNELVFRELVEKGQLRTGPEYATLTAAGKIASSVGQLDSLTIGPFTHRGTLVGESNMNILGLDYLSRFRITLDFPNGVAHLEKGNGFLKREQSGTSGITLRKEAAKMFVRSVRPGGPADLAGILAGDEVIAIQNEVAREIDMFRARQLLTSDPQHTVHMTLHRDNRQFEVAFVVKDRLAKH